MARIENTVFISYRRTDVFTALAVYENLKNQGYDVFFDYRSISSGDFEQIINSNIRARAHFLLILTPTALDRLNEPGDWLRREIETAIDDKRNIIPLFFKGFRFGGTSVSDTLTGKLRNLSRYNGLNVHEDYFDEAMHRLRTQFLNIPLDTVLHPVSTEVQRVVRAEQVAADKALEQIEDVKELVKQTDEKPVQLAEPDPMPELISEPIMNLPGKQAEIPQEKTSNHRPVSKNVKSDSKAVQDLLTPKISIPNLNFRLVGGIVGGALLLALLIWGGVKTFQDKPASTPSPTGNSQVVATQTSRPLTTNTPSPTMVSISATPALGIGSTMTGKDSMTLFYIPAGEFTMGSELNNNAKPVHTVYLDAFWIDQTEVTNALYAKCVQSGSCQPPNPVSSQKHSNYFGNPQYDNYPVIFVTWEMSKTYCEWAERRLPTEAEWEKAARGDDGRRYPWGNDSPVDRTNLSNYDVLAGDTTPIGSYPNGASPYGALDMAGNVSEWVSDWYDASYYANSSPSNPPGPDLGRYHISRGGSWFAEEYGIATWNRYIDTLGISRNSIGFRCAVSQNVQGSLNPLTSTSTIGPSAIPTSTVLLSTTPTATRTIWPSLTPTRTATRTILSSPTPTRTATRTIWPSPTPTP